MWGYSDWESLTQSLTGCHRQTGRHQTLARHCTKRSKSELSVLRYVPINLEGLTNTVCMASCLNHQSVSVLCFVPHNLEGSTNTVQFVWRHASIIRVVRAVFVPINLEGLTNTVCMASCLNHQSCLCCVMSQLILKDQWIQFVWRHSWISQCWRSNLLYRKLLKGDFLNSYCFEQPYHNLWNTNKDAVQQQISPATEQSQVAWQTVWSDSLVQVEVADSLNWPV